MNISDIFPEFNLKEEAEDICQLCKRSVPSCLHFIQPVFVGDAYKDLCPKCTRGIRNLLMGLPKKAMFPGDDANRDYYQFISWLIQEGKE